jgi:DNA-directed RNA polymerase II subunit RPB11
LCRIKLTTMLKTDSSSSSSTTASPRSSTKRRPVSPPPHPLATLPHTDRTTTGVPNTAIFTFNKEDHTLGNLISQRLLKYDYIVFSAYKVPHPLFATFELRVSTDGTITPKDAIIKCCRDVVMDLDALKRSFQTEWLGKKIVSEGERERQERDQQNF